MAHRFLTEAGRVAVREAVAAIEAGSSAEVVVAVRGSSGGYLAADLGVGAGVALATLGFLLFSPWGFSTWALLVDPLVAGAAAVWLSSRLPALRRAVVPAGVRGRWARRAARATFVERGVHHTRGRTGLLVYVGLVEREVLLIPDGAVERALPAAALAAAERGLGEVLRAGGTLVELAAALAAMAAPLALALPRALDDVNELADEVG